MTGTEYVDRTAEPGAVVDAHLDVWEARPVVDVAADVAEAEQVERVARAMAAVPRDCDAWPEMSDAGRDLYRRMAAAALSAVPPADEALRQRVEALADERETEFGDALLPDLRAFIRDLRAILGGAR